MKKHSIALFLIFILSACLTATPKYSPAEIEDIKRIKFVKYVDLPSNKHIKIIGKTKGNYGLKYGKPAGMMWEMKEGAYKLNGDAILPYSTSRQYISFANATIINGIATVISYIEPDKNTILSDYSRGFKGGFLTLSAARFASNYPESESISKEMIEMSRAYRDGSRTVMTALDVLAKAKGRDSIEYFFDYITKARSQNSYNAFMAISPYINKQDTEKLVRFLKFHESASVKNESAKHLIRLGERKTVESYVEKTNNPALAKLLM